MKTVSNKLILIFVSGVILSSLSYSRELLDFTLLPRFILLALTFVALFFFVLKSKEALKFELNILTILYVSYTVFVCLSALWSNTHSESLFEGLKQVLFFFCFFFTLLSLQLNEEFFLKWISYISFIVFTVVFAFFIFQYTSISHENKEVLYEVTGINGHKNLLSSFLFLNLFFLIWAARKSQSIFKILSLILIIVSLIMIVLLKTKAVWLGIFMALFSFLCFWSISKITKKTFSKKGIVISVLISACILNVFFLFLFQPLIHKSIHLSAQTQDTSSLQNQALQLESERLVLWDKTLTMIQQSPILGVGIGNWQINFPNETLSGLWRAEDLNYTFQRPHNDFLWTLSEIGIIGFNLLLLFLLFLLFNIIQLIQLSSNNINKRYDLLIGLAFILGFYLISFFDFPKERIEHSIWINILLGLFVYTIQKEMIFTHKREVSLNKSYIFVLLCLAIFITFSGILRCRSEYYTRKLYDLKNANQKYEVLKTSDKILNYMYCIDPTSVPIQWYTGNANAALGNFEKAKSDFIQSYALTPFNRNVLNDLASAYVMSGEKNLAKKYYEESARISPRFDDPKLNLAAIYIQEKNFEMAEYWLKSLLHDSERRTHYQRLVNQNK